MLHFRLRRKMPYSMQSANSMSKQLRSALTYIFVSVSSSVSVSVYFIHFHLNLDKVLLEHEESIHKVGKILLCRRIELCCCCYCWRWCWWHRCWWWCGAFASPPSSLGLEALNKWWWSCSWSFGCDRIHGVLVLTGGLGGVLLLLIMMLLFVFARRVSLGAGRQLLMLLLKASNDIDDCYCCSSLGGWTLELGGDSSRLGALHPRHLATYPRCSHG